MPPTTWETEAWRRGKAGVLKPVYQGGKKVGSVREYSDTLPILCSKARDPEKYRDRQQIDVTASLTRSTRPATASTPTPPEGAARTRRTAWPGSSGRTGAARDRAVGAAWHWQEPRAWRSCTSVR